MKLLFICIAHDSFSLMFQSYDNAKLSYLETVNLCNVLKAFYL
jgi:hypothetical protein